MTWDEYFDGREYLGKEKDASEEAAPALIEASNYGVTSCAEGIADCTSGQQTCFSCGAQICVKHTAWVPNIYTYYGNYKFFAEDAWFCKRCETATPHNIAGRKCEVSPAIMSIATGMFTVEFPEELPEEPLSNYEGYRVCFGGAEAVIKNGALLFEGGNAPEAMRRLCKLDDDSHLEALDAIE